MWWFKGEQKDCAPDGVPLGQTHQNVTGRLKTFPDEGLEARLSRQISKNRCQVWIIAEDVLSQGRHGRGFQPGGQDDCRLYFLATTLPRRQVPPPKLP